MPVVSVEISEEEDRQLIQHRWELSPQLTLTKENLIQHALAEWLARFHINQSPLTADEQAQIGL